MCNLACVLLSCKRIYFYVTSSFRHILVIKYTTFAELRYIFSLAIFLDNPCSIPRNPDSQRAINPILIRRTYKLPVSRPTNPLPIPRLYHAWQSRFTIFSEQPLAVYSHGPAQLFSPSKCAYMYIYIMCTEYISEYLCFSILVYPKTRQFLPSWWQIYCVPTWTYCKIPQIN